MTTDKYPDDLRLDKDYEQINHPNGVTTWKTKPKVKPEALRLAEILEQTNQMQPNADVGSKEVAAELRRQFEEIKRLHALNQELLEALKLIANTDAVDAALDPQRAVRVASAALAKAQGASNEQRRHYSYGAGGWHR